MGQSAGALATHALQLVGGTSDLPARLHSTQHGCLWAPGAFQIDGAVLHLDL